MQFNNIPAGRFYMGSCKLGTTCPSGAGVDDWAEDDETPQHEVHIRRGFRMGVHEVTVGQFKQYIAETRHYDILTDKRFIEYNSSDDRAPITMVSWWDAQGFIVWLNEKEGTQAYRMPSEAEWEYAARAGTTTKYSWGDAIGRNRANCNGCGSRWDDKSPAPVGSFEANAFGLYDMHCNIGEWVDDCWHDSYKGAPTDGRVWVGCSEAGAIVRGGTWFNYPRILRAAFRGWNRPSVRLFNYGFRLVQDLNP